MHSPHRAVAQVLRDKLLVQGSSAPRPSSPSTLQLIPTVPCPWAALAATHHHALSQGEKIIRIELSLPLFSYIPMMHKHASHSVTPAECPKLGHSPAKGQADPQAPDSAPLAPQQRVTCMASQLISPGDNLVPVY